MKIKNLFQFRYNFDKNTFESNTHYLRDLPKLEGRRVDRWIQSMKGSSSNKETFDEKRFRPLIGINVVRDQIQDMWLQVRKRTRSSFI